MESLRAYSVTYRSECGTLLRKALTITRVASTFLHPLNALLDKLFFDNVIIVNKNYYLINQNDYKFYKKMMLLKHH